MARPSQFTEAEKEHMAILYTLGIPIARIARMYNVSPSAMGYILRALNIRSMSPEEQEEILSKAIQLLPTEFKDQIMRAASLNVFKTINPLPWMKEAVNA